MPNYPGVELLVTFICAMSVLFGHALFSLRFASAPPGSILFAVKWCLLSLGTWILFTATAVGIFALGFHLTEMRRIAELSVFLLAILVLGAVPYHLFLAVLGASVMQRQGGSGRAVLTIVLTIVLSIPVMMIGIYVPMLLWGIEFMD